MRHMLLLRKKNGNASRAFPLFILSSGAPCIKQFFCIIFYLKHALESQFDEVFNKKSYHWVSAVYLGLFKCVSVGGEAGVYLGFFNWGGVPCLPTHSGGHKKVVRQWGHPETQSVGVLFQKVQKCVWGEGGTRKVPPHWLDRNIPLEGGGHYSRGKNKGEYSSEKSYHFLRGSNLCLVFSVKHTFANYVCRGIFQGGSGIFGIFWKVPSPQLEKTLNIPLGGGSKVALRLSASTHCHFEG